MIEGLNLYVNGKSECGQDKKPTKIAEQVQHNDFKVKKAREGNLSDK